MAKQDPAAQPQEPKGSSTTSNKPVHQIRMGRVHCAIWLNETESGKRHNVTVTRSFRDGETWKSSDSFGPQDIPLAKLADQTHTWIVQKHQEAE